MRILKIYSHQLSNVQYSHHAVRYIPKTYLTYNWKFGPQPEISTHMVDTVCSVPTALKKFKCKINIQFTILK